MNIVLMLSSVLLLGMNYFAYKEKISPRVGFGLLIICELSAVLSFYFRQGLTGDLLLVSGLVLLLSAVAFLAPRWFPNLHALIWLEITFLVQAGTFMLYRIDSAIARRHIVICLVGLLTLLPVHFVVKYFRSAYRYAMVYYVLAILLLMMNNVTRYGATNWTRIGNLIYQPSEFVKILFSLFLASFLLKKFRFGDFIAATAMSFAVIGILVWQRDLGGAFIFFTIYVVISYMYSHNKWLLAAQFLLAGGAAAASISLFSHVKVRIISWLHPFEYAQNEGFQIVRSLQALMNGKWLGTGLGHGQPSRIPVVTSDFLFAAIGEEYGAIYLLFFVLHFAFLILLLYNQCLKSRNKFYFYTGTSLTTMLAIQGFLIMGGSSGMIPLTGVVLPFVSYGGSAMVGNFMIVGMIENMTKTEHEPSAHKHPTVDPGSKQHVKGLSKYIRILKYFVFGIYMALFLYLVWLYGFWQMPEI